MPIFHRILPIFPLLAVAAAGAPAVQTVPVSPIGLSFIRLVGGLCMMCGALYGLLWAVKKWGKVHPGQSLRRLRVLESRSVAPKQSLMVVGYDKQRFLIAVGAQGASLVSALPEEEQGDIVALPAPPSFIEAFTQVLARKG